MVEKAGDWFWSSYQITLGKASKPFWLSPELILAQFSTKSLIALKKYQDFVEEGLITHSPWIHFKKQIFLGSEDFVNKMQSQINLEINLTDIPRAQYTPVGCSLMEYAEKYTNRNGMYSIGL
ncbi:MAG: hypothetical protein Q8R83_09250 [Legionellaceae bacterium]|nr:hypothetical protein [Legionellaceae bacterium]